MRKMVVLTLVVTLLAAACGGDDDGADATDDNGDGGPAIAVTSGDLGEFLVDADGNTLYLFTPDAGAGESQCYDDCADLWPPLEGPVSAGDEVDAGLVGTTERDDGITQVTYNGHPLYYYAPDSAPGETEGQGVGDVWWVVDAAGDPIT